MAKNDSGRRGGGTRRDGNRGGGAGNRASRRLTRRARRDVRASFKPQFNLLEREQTRAEQDASQYQGQMENLYGGLQNQLAEIGPQYQGQVADIQGNLTGSLGTLTGMLGGTPAGEQAAAAGAFGAVGEGGLAGLASQAARGAGYNASAMRQGAIDQVNYSAAILEELKQFKQALSEQRQDLTGEMAPLILSRIDELKERARQMALANKEFQLRKQATTQGLGLEKARFGLERRERSALAGLTQAQIQALLDKINRQRGGR
jgi:hypothetical protein